MTHSLGFDRSDLGPVFRRVPSFRDDVLSRFLAGLGVSGIGDIGAAAEPAPATKTPSISVQEAFSRIPTAEAGHVIGPDLHNSVREFCQVVALALTGGVDRGLTVDVPLILQATASGTANAWTADLGRLVNGDGTADGWTTADLPDGVRITGLKVTGRRGSGNAGAVQVLLLRVHRLDPDEDPVSLVTARLGDLPEGPMDPPLFPLRPGVPQATPELTRSFATVDRSEYRYLVQATVDADPDAPAKNSTTLYTVQVVCDRF
jgi:hypothetical protein